MIRSRRSLALLAAVAGLSLLSCGREVTGPGDGIQYGRGRIASLALEPRFPTIPGVNAISDVVAFSQVRITLRRTDGAIARDTLVTFPAGADSIALAIDVPLPITAPDSGLTLGLSLAYVNAAGDTVFRGGPLPITVRPAGRPGSTQTVSIPVSWVPPVGVPLPASVDLTPATGSAVAGSTTAFSAVARDGQGQPIAGIPVLFTSLDTTRATVAAPGNGLVTWRPVRGAARIVATLPNLVADTATFTVALPASRLLAVSGDAQSATTNTALAAPLVLRVTASDSVPVSGIPVTFAVTTGGGTLLALADTSDATGLVQTSWTLGALVGAQSVTATLTTNNATFVATATGLAPVPTQVVFTASPTTAVAGSTLTAVTVEARDAGGARASAFTGPVTIALDAGGTGATLAGTTTVNAVAGIATFADLSIQRAATGLTFIATSAGLTADTSSALTITAAAAATLVNVSGTGQAVAISTALAAPFIVRVTDAFANPIAGATVTWTITAGGGSLSAPTSVTAANGEASVTYTTGTATGTSVVTGAVAGLTGSPASFSATVGAGAPTSLVFTASPTGTFTAGTIMSDIVVQARDAGGNLAAAFAGNVVLRINTGPGANGDSLVVAAVGGVATFSGVDFGDAGTYTLRANAAGLTAAISPAFDIVAGPPSTIGIIAGNGQSGTISAPLADSLVFVVRDSVGNPVANVGWTIAVTGGGGSVSPAGGNTDAAGEIRVRWTLGAALGPQSISAFVTATPAISVGASATATASGGATQLAITQQPGNTTSNAPIPAIIVEARTAVGALATGFTGNIEVVVDSGPQAGWSMGGTQIVAATGGVATFSTVTLDRAGQYTLRFRSAGLDSVISAPFLVNAGAAAALAPVEGDGQTAPASSTLATPLGARLTDAAGNPISGATVSWTVTSGLGSVTPTSSTTDADGIARSAWTLGAVVGPQGAEASSAGFTAPFTANATASEANIVWTGAVNSNWSVAGNWSSGTVPTIADSVRIPLTATSPVLDAAAFASKLRIDADVDLQLDTFPLLIGRALDVDPGATVGNSSAVGSFVLSGTTGTVRGIMPRLMVTAGTFALDGPISVASDLVISGGSLAFGSNAATISGDLVTSGTGTFSQTGPGTVTVEGSVILTGGSTAGLLTSGVLRVRADFAQAGGSPQAFSASAGHTVVLDGPATQTVALLTPDLNLNTACAASCFGTLRSLRGAGSGALRINSNLKALGMIDVSGDSLDAAGQGLISVLPASLASDVVVARFVAWQGSLVRTAGTFAVDSLVAWGSGALIVGEVVPTAVVGAYTVTGAHPAPVVVEAGGTLDVVGVATIGGGAGPALTTRGTGRVLMQQAGDTLTVAGDADFGGATAPGLMNAGVLRIGGDFAMTNESADAFIAEGAHVTRLFANNPTARFSRIGGNQFASLAIDATGAMTFDGNATIAGTVTVGPTTSVVGGGFISIGGDLIDSLGFRWQATETSFSAADPVVPRQFTGSVVFNNGVVIDTTMTIGGNLEIRGGLLDLNGRHVTVAGNFEARTSGVLRMVSPADTLIVGGTAIFRGGSSLGQLTAGRLELAGSFQQTGNAEAFAADAGHETWFTSPSTASVTFATPGSGAGSSHFGTVYLAQPSGTFALGSDVYVDGLLENGTIAIASQVTGNGERLVSRGADFSSLQFNNVRWLLTDGAPVDRIDSLTFSAMDPAAIAFEIVRSGGTIAIPNLTFAGAVPTTGRYLRVEDSDGAAGGVLTVDLTLVSPPSNSGYLEVVNGAVVNGWGIGAFVWTGLVDNAWTNPGNWAANAVPAALDSVYVPAAGVTNLPSILGPTVVRSLVNDNPLPITIDASNTLTIIAHAAFREDVVGLRCNSGALDIGTGAPTATLRGRVDCVVNAAATSTTLSGPTTIDGAGNSFSAVGTDFSLNGQRMVVAGTFVTQGSGRLVMANAVDSLDVGDADFSGASTAGLLTDGDLVIRGNLLGNVSAGSFTASGTHRTRFLAGIGDTASVTALAGPVSFGRLDVTRPVRVIGVANASADVLVGFGGSLTGTGRLAVGGTFTGVSGTLVQLAAVQLSGVMADTGTFRPDTTIFAGNGQVMPFRVGAAAIPAYQVVRITGDVTMAPTGSIDSVGTDLLIDGGQFRVDDAATMAFLRVGRDFRVTNGGRLFSLNQNHQFLTYRHVLFDGADATGALVLGNFRLRGDFTQLATTSSTSFVPGPNFFVALDSVGTISFATPGPSRFSQVTLAQFGPDRTLLSDVEVANTFYVTSPTGATLRSAVPGAGGARRLTMGSASLNEALTTRNVQLRLLGSGFAEAAAPLTFADFDPDVVQFEIVRDSGAIDLFDPTFTTTPSANGRYLRVIDSNVGDALNLTVNIVGSPTPTFHNGYAEAQAPAVLNGWGQSAEFRWTGGATDSDWNNPANWSGGAVPAATDSVFVPGALLYNPLIPDGTTLRALVSARTEGPISAAGALTITERLSVPTLGGITCGGALAFTNPSTPMQVRGRVTCFTRILDGTLTVSDTLGIFENDLQVEGTATFDMGSGVASVDGQFSTLGAARLRMQDAAASLGLNSGASFGGGSTAGLLTAGLLEIGGNFTQNGDAESFAASGTHATVFRGSGTQQATFAAPGLGAGTSHFAHVALGAEVGLQLNSDAYASGQLRDGPGSGRMLTTSSAAVLVTGGASFTSANLVGVRWEIRDGSTVDALSGIAFQSMDPTVAQLSVIRSAGTVTADNLDFDTPPTSGVYILVSDPDGAANGSSVLALSSMVPAVHSGFISQQNTATITGWPVVAAETWTGAVDSDWANVGNWSAGVVPDQSTDVSIPVTANGPVISDQRAVRNLTIATGATLTLFENDTLTVGGNLVVSGTVAGSAPNDSTIVLRMSTLGIASLAAPGTIATKLLLTGGSIALTDSVRVTGDATMGVEVAGGTLDLNQRRMDVTGSFKTSGDGALQMQDPADSLLVDENVIFGGGSTEGLLTNGTMIVGRDFFQELNASSRSFVATGNHLVRFVGSTYESVVNLTSSNTLDSRFARVALDKALPRATRFFNTPVTIADLVSISGPVIVDNGNVAVTGTVAQPGPNGTWEVGPTAGVLLSGVNPATCDGLSFVVTNTPAAFSPTACWNPPAPEMAWTGAGGNSLWSNPANWSLNRIPVAGDSVVIDQNVTVDLNGPATVAWMIMGLSSTPTLNLNNGATLQVDSAAITTTGTTVNLVSGATLTGSGGVSIGGQLNWTGGTMSGSGVTVLAAGATGAMATVGSVSIADRVLAVSGTLDIGAGSVNVSGDPSLTVLTGGTVNLAATNSFFAGTGTMDIVNNGTLRKSASAGLVRMDWPIVNTGTLIVADDTLDLRSTFDHVLGTVSVNGGGKLVSRGESNVSAAVSVAVGSALELTSGGLGGSVNNGNHTFGPTSSITGAGRLRIISADSTFIRGAMDIDSLVVQNGDTFFESVSDTMFVTDGAYLGGGFFRGSGVLGIRGAFSTNGGNLDGTGSIAVLPGATFTLGGDLRGWTLDAAGGTVVWGNVDLEFADDPDSGTPAQMIIRSGGVFDIAHGAVDRELFGTGSVAPPNHLITVLGGGTIRKSSGTAISNIRPRILLSGAFDVLTGTINVQGSCAVTGGTKTGPGQLTGNFSPTGGCVIP